jgi:hypothetical protein
MWGILFPLFISARSWYSIVIIDHLAVPKTKFWILCVAKSQIWFIKSGIESDILRSKRLVL